MRSLVDAMIVVCVSGAMLACVMGAVDCRELLGTKCNLQRTLNCGSKPQGECDQTACTKIRCTKLGAADSTRWLGSPVPTGANGTDANSIIDVTDPEDTCGTALAFVPFAEAPRFNCFWSEGKCKCATVSEVNPEGTWMAYPNIGPTGCGEPRKTGGQHCVGQ